jgi:hypothetical protein
MDHTHTHTHAHTYIFLVCRVFLLFLVEERLNDLGCTPAECWMLTSLSPLLTPIIRLLLVSPSMDLSPEALRDLDCFSSAAEGPAVESSGAVREKPKLPIEGLS